MREKNLYYDLKKYYKECKQVKFEKIHRKIQNEFDFCCRITSELNEFLQDLIFELMNNYDQKLVSDMSILILRDILQNVDAIEILFKNKAHTYISALLRNIFERLLIIAYMTDTEKIDIQEKRAYEYYLSNLYERINYLKKLKDVDGRKNVLKEIKRINKNKLNKNSEDTYRLCDKYNNINIHGLSKKVKYEELYKRYYSSLSSNLHGKTVLDYYSTDGEYSLLQELRIPFNSVVVLREYFDIMMLVFDMIGKDKRNIISDDFKIWRECVNKEIERVCNESIIVYSTKDESKIQKLDSKLYIELKKENDFCN